MSKIQLTRELPTEEGYYFYTRGEENPMLIITVLEIYYSDVLTELRVRGPNSSKICDYEGGRWAKVEQSMFEIAD